MSKLFRDGAQLTHESRAPLLLVAVVRVLRLAATARRLRTVLATLRGLPRSTPLHQPVAQRPHDHSAPRQTERCALALSRHREAPKPAAVAHPLHSPVCTSVNSASGTPAWSCNPSRSARLRVNRSRLGRVATTSRHSSEHA